MGDIEAFAEYVNRHLVGAEFGVDWVRDAFTYRAEDSAVFVRIAIKDFGKISNGVMYVTSAIGIWLIMTTLKRGYFDGRINNNSLAVHFG